MTSVIESSGDSFLKRFRSWHELRPELFIPLARSEIFSFFADAHNLEAITPPWLRFRVLTPAPIAMNAGALIDYRLRLRGIPLRWRTLIHIWEPPDRFVDVQIRGPYRLWYHEHTFESVAGGTLVRDRVRYVVPGGRLVHDLFVRREVERIFAFRQAAIESRFCRV